MTTFRSILLLAPVLLAGCATAHYGCPAPDGVTCMSAGEVYQATQSADRVTGKAAPRPERRGAATNESGARRGVVLIDHNTLTLADDPAVSDVVPTDQPLRSPARVMRVWFAPWEDTAGDLHMAGTVFTEIEPRRWTVGQKAPDTATALQLLEPLSSPQPKAESSAGSAGTTPTAPQGRTERPPATSTTEPATTPPERIQP